VPRRPVLRGPQPVSRAFGDHQAKRAGGRAAADRGARD
jgi:hypothetical protein